MEHLKSCPFCGCKRIDLRMASFEQNMNDGDQAWRWIVGCPLCDLWIAKHTAGQAVAAWNRRKKEEIPVLIHVPVKKYHLLFK